jgi:hypothetical protein
MRRFLRDNGLSVTMFGLFLVFLVGQSVAGWKEHNDDQTEHGKSRAGFVEYLGTGHFWEATFENWESEFLQMAGYVFLTACLYQRGSAESKDPDKPEPVDEDPERHRDDPNAPGPVRRGGLALKFYSQSLSLAFLTLFLLSFAGHAVGGHEEYNQERIEHGEPAASLGDYVGSSAFWFESFQNWQSEFLAVGAMVVLSIWLRQKGSPESKPVHKPHQATGNE